MRMTAVQCIVAVVCRVYDGYYVVYMTVLCPFSVVISSVYDSYDSYMQCIWQ